MSVCAGTDLHAQCGLQLSPATPCDIGITTFAALTFVVFTVSFMASIWFAIAAESENPLVMFIVHPYADVSSRWIWAVPLRFGRKLWFAIIMSAWQFSQPETAGSLAVLIFVSLVVFLMLHFWLRPYRDARDNWLETVCIAILLYAYFVSSLRGAPVSIGASVSVLEVGLTAYAVYRWVRQRFWPDAAPAGKNRDTAHVGELSRELL
jgi:hypothetical protein